ncbi:DUF2267 domain-containing protein [Kineobactrum sediminis]|uniref:DUF2267 domain-containing protein n=1 Tax=Kineobactrum sediminis TaxID=1905677 RepID=A0A2N5Y1I8_9GAMM|nr:DUF2267 domain-containing protein [Kineobactrum sediminis]PLW82252.1 DUF2267 domain-containing protein [Kineobactrum sediminis]
MVQGTLKIIEHSSQDAYKWLSEIADGLDRPQDLGAACHALRAVLHTLRDTLVPDEAMDLGAQLPTLIRGIYYEGYKLTERPVVHRHEADFLQAIASSLERGKAPELDSRLCATTVFATLAGHISAGEAGQVRDMLKKEIQELWPV